MRVDNNIQKKTEKTNKDKPIIHNVIITDASGSMGGSKYNSSIKAINDELEILSMDENSTFVHTLIEFNDCKYKEHCFMSKDFSSFQAVGASCGTPLYNTMGKVFEQLEKEIKPEERVLIKIFTDGEDTDYNKGKYNSSSISTYVKKLIDVNKWTITFNCTTQDKIHLTRIGILESNILAHNNTAEDIERVGQMRTSSTRSYSKAVSFGVSADVLVSNFYSKTINNNEQI